MRRSTALRAVILIVGLGCAVLSAETAGEWIKELLG